MNTQPQLFPISLNPNDIVYTPDDVAHDIVNYFQPTGRILEPCCGDGAFLKYLPPDTDWCEIEKGRDFFANHNHYDWIIGNPPFSLLDKWFQHSFEIADNVVYLLLYHMMFSTVPRLKTVEGFGGIKTALMLGTAKQIALLDGGFLCGAFHFQRGYTGGMFTVFRDSLSKNNNHDAMNRLDKPINNDFLNAVISLRRKIFENAGWTPKSKDLRYSAIAIDAEVEALDLALQKYTEENHNEHHA